MQKLKKKKKKDIRQEQLRKSLPLQNEQKTHRRTKSGDIGDKNEFRHQGIKYLIDENLRLRKHLEIQMRKNLEVNQAYSHLRIKYKKERGSLPKRQEIFALKNITCRNLASCPKKQSFESPSLYNRFLSLKKRIREKREGCYQTRGDLLKPQRIILGLFDKRPNPQSSSLILKGSLCLKNHLQK